MTRLAPYILVALGGAIGSAARLWLSSYVAVLTRLAFPWGTILVNVVGSLIIGFFGTFTGPDGRLPASLGVRAFVMVGICGGFTTFSAFSLQTLDLAREGQMLQAGVNIVLSLVLCLAAVALGHWLALLCGRA